MTEPEPMDECTKLALMSIVDGCINHLDKAPSVVVPVIKELGKILESRKIHSENYVSSKIFALESDLIFILERRWIEMDSKGLTKVRTKDS